MEMNLVRDVKGDKKGFYKYISDKSKTSENVSFLQKETESWLHGAVKRLKY